MLNERKHWTKYGYYIAVTLDHACVAQPKLLVDVDITVESIGLVCELD